jgi:predicted acylesterase/phospholipase RssA
MPDRYLNLVFQGGGVRGIAYAGALSAMPVNSPDPCRINAVGGTSAGAIMAALIAIGTPIDQITEYLKEPDLFRLLEETELARIARIREAWEELQRLFRERGRFFLYRLWKFSKKHRMVWENDLAAIWDDRGWPAPRKLGQFEVESVA